MSATNSGADLWFYQIMGKQLGPISSAQLRVLANAGTVAPDTMVKRGAAGGWMPAGRVQGLFPPPTVADRSAAKNPTVPCPPPPLPPRLPPVPSFVERIRGFCQVDSPGRILALVATAIGLGVLGVLCVAMALPLASTWTRQHTGKKMASIPNQSSSPEIPKSPNGTPDFTTMATPAAKTDNSNDSVVPEPAGPAVAAVETKPAPIVRDPEAWDLPSLVERVAPSVVLLKLRGPAGPVAGSGFVIDKEGTVVTNFHVVQRATEGKVVFSDETNAPITGYVDAWPGRDIALLHVECSPEKLHPLEIAKSPPRPGERVAAFGSPLGLSGSVSDGIVGGVRQSKELQTLGPVDIDALLIQTTAPISHGNSGGPLVNLKGMVVGINTLGFASHGGQNVNFAVSSAEVPSVALGENKRLLSIAPYASPNERIAMCPPGTRYIDPSGKMTSTPDNKIPPVDTLPRISTPAEYAPLPGGTWYVGSNGKPNRKTYGNLKMRPWTREDHLRGFSDD